MKKTCPVNNTELDFPIGCSLECKHYQYMTRQCIYPAVIFTRGKCALTGMEVDVAKDCSVKCEYYLSGQCIYPKTAIDVHYDAVAAGIK